MADDVREAGRVEEIAIAVLSCRAYKGILVGYNGSYNYKVYIPVRREE